MSSKGGPGPAPGRGDRIARATALIRALTGVVDASVEGHEGSIRSIVVVAEPPVGAWEVTRNVQSALLASLGLAIDTAVVEVRRPEPGLPGAPPRPAGPPAGRAQPSEPPAPAPPGNGAGRVNGDGAGKPAGANHNGRRGDAVPANGATGEDAQQRGDGARAEDAAARTPGGGAPSTGKTNGKANGKANDNGRPRETVPGDGAGNGAGARNGSTPRFAVTLGGAPELAVETTGVRPRTAGGASVARLELQALPAGRIACRVVVATADRIAAGEAAGLDSAAGRLEVAARAVIAASPMAGVELDAVRLLELAGRGYVIAAVRCWSGREMTYRADVAPVAASPEAAAAQATLGAILQ